MGNIKTGNQRRPSPQDCVAREVAELRGYGLQGQVCCPLFFRWASSLRQGSEELLPKEMITLSQK